MCVSERLYEFNLMNFLQWFAVHRENSSPAMNINKLQQGSAVSITRVQSPQGESFLFLSISFSFLPANVDSFLVNYSLYRS